MASTIPTAAADATSGESAGEEAASVVAARQLVEEAKLGRWRTRPGATSARSMAYVAVRRLVR